MSSSVGRSDAAFVASLEIRLRASLNQGEDGGSSSNNNNGRSTGSVSRSRSMRRPEHSAAPSSSSSSSSRLALPVAPPRTSRSLSPALRRTPESPFYYQQQQQQQQHCPLHGMLLPTRKPTPPQDLGHSSSSHWRQQPRTPPSSPMEVRKRLAPAVTSSSSSPSLETSSCPSTPLLQRSGARLEVPSRRVFGAQKDSGYDDRIVVPRRASGLSRSPSPSPSRHGSSPRVPQSLTAPPPSVPRSPSPGRSPSLKVAALVSKQVLSDSASVASAKKQPYSSAAAPIQLSNLIPPAARKYGTASMASYDRSDSDVRSPEIRVHRMTSPPSTPPPSRKIGTCPRSPPSSPRMSYKSGSRTTDPASRKGRGEKKTSKKKPEKELSVHSSSA